MKYHQIQTIHALALAGFTPCEISDLLKISRRLQRWHELECGTSHPHNAAVPLSIERNESGKPFLRRQFQSTRGWQDLRNPYPDYERAALRKLAGIMEGKACRAYVQGDPQGCALYILRPDDVPAGQDDDCFYNRGIAVCD